MSDVATKSSDLIKYRDQDAHVCQKMQVSPGSSLYEELVGEHWDYDASIPS
jgi:hypothetical protein